MVDEESENRVNADPKSWERNQASTKKTNWMDCNIGDLKKRAVKKVKVLSEVALDKPISECRKQSCHNLGK